MADTDFTLTISETAEGVHAEIWCPAFVADEDCGNVHEALMWAKARCEGRAEFFVYEED